MLGKRAGDTKGSHEVGVDPEGRTAGRASREEGHPHLSRLDTELPEATEEFIHPATERFSSRTLRNSKILVLTHMQLESFEDLARERSP